MRPFQQFRMWARRAPLSERVTTGLAALVAVGLLAWLLVPDGNGSSTEDLFATEASEAPGTAAGGAGTTVPLGDGGGGAATAETPAGAEADAGGGDAAAPSGGDGSAVAPEGGGGGGAPADPDTGSGSPDPGAGPAAGGEGCVSPPGNFRGVSAGEVKVAVVLTQIVGPAANQLFDIPTPAEAKADFEAAVAGINQEGGVACRKLVATYVEANPIDESQMMGLCRTIGSGDYFAVMDTGSLATRPAVLACFGQRKIPYFGAFYITEQARRQFYPYLYSFYTKEHLYKNTTFALRDTGFFDPAKGLKKLGFIYRDCEKEAIGAFRGWIREAGVPDAQVVTYSVGCPALFATEADIAQAVLTFKSAGVTHVTMGNFQGDIARFTAQAEQQDYRPKYGIPDEAILSIASGSRAPDPDNIANAVAITLSREGENKTPGMTPTPGTQRCDAYRQAAGLKPVYDVPANAGHACDQLWMLQAALARAPELSPAGLQAGLKAAKSIDFSFPQGPNDFSGNRITTGGQFWRVAKFTPGCKCWRLAQPEFKRGWF